ncbi:MAG: Ankyrin repeat domain-containing protein 44, partial [Watsoniomyces obsoletus]
TGNVKLVKLLLDNGADVDELTARGSVLSQAITAGREEITSLLLSRDADINLARYPIQSPLGNAVTRKNERLIKDLLKRGAETDVLLEQLYEVTAKQLSESCQDLLRDWQAQKYEEQVQIIRDSSSEIAEKENALVAALKSASKHRQPEIHSMFVELAEEFNIAREKEY